MDIIGTALNLVLPVCIGLAIALIARGPARILGVLGVAVTVVWSLLLLPGVLITRVEPTLIGLLGLPVRIVGLGLLIAAAAVASRQRPAPIQESTAEPSGWAQGGDLR